MGVPQNGTYTVMLNSDDVKYGGMGVGNKTYVAKEGRMHGLDYHIDLCIPGNSVMFLKLTKKARKKTNRKTTKTK